VQQSDAQLAAGLINTKTLPPGLMSIQKLAAQARAYDKLLPYPLFWFKNWKEEDRGPLPRCMPIAKAIVRRGARWLFGKPLEITFPGNETLEQQVKSIWTKNRMPSRLTAIARKGALEGGIVFKFAYDETADPQISIQSLSLMDQVRLYYHPHNRERLLMARVQYPYYDAEEGCTYWYREEWTDAAEVHFYPVKDESLSKSDPDTYEGWKIDEASSRPNPFGLIPLHRIKNLETDDVWGSGDLWDIEDEPEGGLFRVLDRIHLSYHLMDRSNQFDSAINPIYLDVDVDQDDLDKPTQPGEGKSFESTNETGHPGRVVFPPTGNALRPAMMEYAKDLRKQYMDAASSVFIDQAEFSNKGNLTNAVLAQLYLPQIEITEDKRKTYGDDGLVPFLARMARGLQRAGVDLGVREADDKTYTAELKWSAYFELSEDEKTAKVLRTQEEEIGGYVPHERAIEEISMMDGRTDIVDIKKQLESQSPPPVQQAQIDQNAKSLGSVRRVGGPNAL
jgi:hypothetical protein